MACMEGHFDIPNRETRSSYANLFLQDHLQVMVEHDEHTADGQSLSPATIQALEHFLTTKMGHTIPQGYDSPPPSPPKQGQRRGAGSSMTTRSQSRPTSPRPHHA